MLNLAGNKLANGEFVQWIENGVLHVTIDYDFGNGHEIKEQTSLLRTPRLVQNKWNWEESTNGLLLRHFEVNFISGKAIAEKQEGHERKRWSEDIKVEPGRTFAGFTFVLAIEHEHRFLENGGKLRLQVVGFTPKPRVVPVEISRDGLDQMKMAARIVRGERFTIHPEVPAIAKLFVEVKDTHIWLTTLPAVGFLRWEGPLVEADDPVVRVDLLPGNQSGTAEPASPSNLRQGKNK